jgi:hypothetical protein
VNDARRFSGHDPTILIVITQLVLFPLSLYREALMKELNSAHYELQVGP